MKARILDGIALLGVDQASNLLRMEVGDPADAMRAMIDRREVIALIQNGVWVFWGFQFDAERGRVFDAVQRILRLRPQHKTDLWLCYWLTRLHGDLAAAPVAHFGRDDDAIVAAFAREIESARHG